MVEVANIQACFGLGLTAMRDHHVVFERGEPSSCAISALSVTASKATVTANRPIGRGVSPPFGRCNSDRNADVVPVPFAHRSEKELDNAKEAQRCSTRRPHD